MSHSRVTKRGEGGGGYSGPQPQTCRPRAPWKLANPSIQYNTSYVRYLQPHDYPPTRRSKEIFNPQHAK